MVGMRGKLESTLLSVQSVLHLTAAELAENTREKIETEREAASRRVFLNLEAEHGAVLNRLSCGFPSHLE